MKVRKNKADGPEDGGGYQKRVSGTIKNLAEKIKAGDTPALARAITLMESTRPGDRELAHALVEYCLPPEEPTMRIGITGAPGVGKSTFIEALGSLLVKNGKKVAVLAVDPSSSLSKGSIMGDKTRMQELANSPMAFIRPSPSAENLGGVTRSTRETIILCEAAGFNVILIETVGVGQSETVVHSMVDFFLLLQLAGAGDELQGIKRGIMEMADAVVINKADGSNRKTALEARSAFANALQLYPPKENGWKVAVLSCSSLENKGVDEVWQLIEKYFETYIQSSYLIEKRQEQNAYWFRQSVESNLADDFYSHPIVKKQFPLFLDKVRRQELSPFRAASLLMEAFRQELK